MEFYLMPMFNKIMVNDIEKSSKWYEKCLGFESVFKFRDQNNNIIMDHLRLNKYQDIMLIQSSDVIVGNGLRINLSVKDINRLADNIPKGNIVEPLALQPWNATEITIKDRDGYLITLTEVAHHNSQTSFDEVIKHTSKKYC